MSRLWEARFTSDMGGEDYNLIQQVGMLLRRVLPLGMVAIIMIIAAEAMLILASWLGQLLFQIPAKDSLLGFSGQSVLVAIAITLLGSFFFDRRPLKAGLAQLTATTILAPAIVPQAEPQPKVPQAKAFIHELVSGGRDAGGIVEAPAVAFRPITPQAKTFIHELVPGGKDAGRIVKVPPVAFRPIAPPAKTFVHELVPGGKDAGRPIEKPTFSGSIRAANMRPFDPPQRAFENNLNRIRPKEPIINQPALPAQEAAKMLPIPDRLEARVEPVSFNCPECKGVLALPWKEVEESREGKQVSVDCPQCKTQRPFNYDFAKGKKLAITFFAPRPAALLEKPLEAQVPAQATTA